MCDGEFLKKWPRAFSRGYFANYSVLDVCRGSDYNSGDTGFSEEGPWLFVLVIWPAHSRTDGVISFDFPVLL